MEGGQLRFAISLDSSDLESFRPSISDQARCGFFGQDVASQTEQSEIVYLKEVSTSVQMLMNNLAVVKRDLNFAKHVLRADYEAKMDARAGELYVRLNERLTEVEAKHKAKVDIVRKSYRTQLADAVARISGEYKTYYEGIMQGKFGRHDGKLKDVQAKNEELQNSLQQNESVIQMLQMQLHQAQTERETLEENEGFEVPSATLDGGISLEEFEEVQEKLESAENKVDELHSELLTKDSTVRQLTTKVNQLSEELKEGQARVAELQRDLDSEKQKARAAAGRATEAASRQIADLEAKMKSNIEKAKKSAYEQAVKEAEEQRNKKAGQFESELARRQAIEEQLKKEQERLQGDGAVAALKQLQKIEKEQKAEIARLKCELDRQEKTWQIKFAVLQRTLHAVKDESYIRASLHRQSTRLHHATVAYARDIPQGVVTRGRNPGMKAVLPCIDPKPSANNIPECRDDVGYTEGQIEDAGHRTDSRSSLQQGSSTRCADEAEHQELIPRSVSQGHVIVVPSVGIS
ncbi:myosin-4-like [Corticium candelabrum]|uniref:myosin-4-like n=1 Tax=Corticium candelabrum TaxID=121492 RepID=UPI002E27592D|nr:myosin-4-like [Corticium candelabrum]